MKTGFAGIVFFLLTLLNSSAAVLHVDLNSTNPVSPYGDWSTAATNIQDAVDASTNGDLVLVTNGVYAGGGKSMDGIITNRAALYKAITVQSVNGPSVTIIQGAWDPISINGPGAVRCAWLTNNAILSGFTLRNGATRPYSSSGKPSSQGGGVWANVTRTGISPTIHLTTSATVTNCIIVANSAGTSGGGAYGAKLDFCLVIGNCAPGNGVIGTASGIGGGAELCNITACVVSGNAANENGGGADNCCLTNSEIVQNRAVLSGSGVNGGTLVNCTLTQNTSGGYGDYGGAVADAVLINCIVYHNFNIGAGSTNYDSSTFSYCDSDPLPAGVGNRDVDPQILLDGVHLAQTSPCISAGTNSVVSGRDIDGQSWNNPPSIGCDEWQPEPVIATQPACQINSPANGLTFHVLAAGQTPLTYFWAKDGVPVQDDGHDINSGTTNLIVNHFGPDDAGFYQVVASNVFGMITSQLAQVVIHAVDSAGANPVPPYTNWATAATNIQDAIDAAAPGEIVLVTNGIYANGGGVASGSSTNRIVLNKALIVLSVNGYTATTVQGAWDPVSTNGSAAIRCAWLTNGAVLSGFTLEDGATGTGVFVGASYDSGGGVWCASTNAVVSNCELTNNSSIFGGGIYGGTLNNSLVVGNAATYGGGAFNARLNNCTVVSNYCAAHGGGTYSGVVRNSIVLANYNYAIIGMDDYYSDSGFSGADYSWSFTYPMPTSGTGNLDPTNAAPFLDLFHIASTSACRGAGNELYANGTDLDGEPWANPPSIGCDEVVLSNLIGPLSVSLTASQTNVLVSLPAAWPPPHYDYFQGFITGRAAYATWSFGDGPTFSNYAALSSHYWTNTGDYAVTVTVFNMDNPAGVATNTLIHVLLPDVPRLQSPVLLGNVLVLQFAGQLDADYTIQYTTNLVPPVTWQTLKTIFWNFQNTIQVNDPAPTNAARFYRVLTQ